MRKNCKLCSLTIAIALSALTAIAVADPYVCGDANASGGVDIDRNVYRTIKIGEKHLAFL